VATFSVMLYKIVMLTGTIQFSDIFTRIQSSHKLVNSLTSQLTDSKFLKITEKTALYL